MNEFIRSQWAKSKRPLAAAEATLDTDPDSAASRAYYAAFHGVTAVLAGRGMEFTKHTAVRAALHGDETAVRYTWMMPKIFEQDGYSFFFYSNDHIPIHVHVRRGGGEAVFVVEPEVELRESVGFNVRELSRAEDLIDDHLELIKQKWAEHLG